MSLCGASARWIYEKNALPTEVALGNSSGDPVLLRHLPGSANEALVW